MEELAKLVFMIIAVSSATEIMPSRDWHGIVKRTCLLTINTNS